MSELPSKDVYQFINGYDNHNAFKEFARNRLHLKDREINDILADYSGQREQKYQIICYWKRKVGRGGTIEKLNEFRELDRIAAKDENDHETSHAPIQQRQDADNEQRDNRVEPPPEDAQLMRGQVDERAFILNNAEPTSKATGDRLTQAGVTSSPDAKASSSTVPKAVSSTDADDTSDRNKTLPKVIASTGAQIENLSVQSDPDYCADITDLKVRECTDKEIIANLTKGSRTGMYLMTKKPKGNVIIINNSPPSHSTLSQKDTENMKNLWTALDCKVAVKENLSASEIDEVFAKVKSSPHVLCSDYLGFFLIGKSKMISGQEAVMGTDNKPVFLQQMVDSFSHQNFQAFTGKPKLFFCHLLTPDDSKELQVFPDQLVVASRQMCFDLTSNSANGGSWFVNSVANVFAKFSQKEPIQQLLQRIGTAFDDKVTSLDDSASICSRPAIAVHSQIKPLYLLPGHPKDDLFD